MMLSLSFTAAMSSVWNWEVLCHKCLLLRTSPSRNSWRRITKPGLFLSKPRRCWNCLVCMNVHECIRNGVIVSFFFNEGSRIACWKQRFRILLFTLWFLLEPRVWLLTRGELRALTSACGPGCHRSGHTHTHRSKGTQKHTRVLLWKGSVTVCLP